MSPGRQPLAVSEGSVCEVLDYCQIFFSFARTQGSDVVITMFMCRSYLLGPFNMIVFLFHKHKSPGRLLGSMGSWETLLNLVYL